MVETNDMDKEQVMPNNTRRRGNSGSVDNKETISLEEFQQRLKNFENFNDNQSAKIWRNEIDENINNIPKMDNTKKMLEKFKVFEANQSVNNGAPESLNKNKPVIEKNPKIGIFDVQSIVSQRLY